MKEVIKDQDAPLTDVLDPSGKPYLVLDQNDGRYHVIYWKAWFRGPRWISSDWYDDPNPDSGTTPSRKAKSWPQRLRIWELPGVEYAPPTNYTHKIA